MKKAFPVIFSLLLAVLCGGCLHLKQLITLKKDGGMTVQMTYSVPAGQVGALSAGYQAIAGWQGDRTARAAWFLDEQAVRRFFNHPEDGVEVLVYKTYQRDGRQFAEIAVTAKNAAQALEQGYFGEFRLTAPNTLVMRFPEHLDDLPKEDIRHLRTLCADLSIELSVQTPGDITSTNGYKRNPNLAVWHFSADGNGLDIFGTLRDLTVNW